MKDLKELLNSLNPQPEQTSAVQIPFAPQATMPDDLAHAAQQEAAPVMSAPAALPVASPKMPQAPVLDPHSLSQSSMSQTKSSSSGTLPPSHEDGTPESKLEKLMKDLHEQRNKERDDADSRQFKSNIVKALTDNIGNIVGGAQAMHTGAHVTPTQTHGFDPGDLVAGVDKKFTGDREALMDQYKTLLNAKDRADTKKFQNSQLDLTRQGLAIKQQIADAKASAGPGETKGQEALNKDFGKKYAEWTSNGRASADTNIKKLQEVYDELNALPENEKNSDDRFIGRAYDVFQPEEKIQRREKVRSAAQEALRATLGAQFTEKEGETIMARAYDPRLSPKANMERIKTVLDERIQARDEKNRQSGEFEKTGSLNNYKPEPSKISANSTISKVAAPAGMITVRNEAGDERHIDPADEAEAATDKYYKVK